ncbi:MAG: hypothetical protein HXM15_02250 [Fusobacterium periodonticum]|nr:hypothetical protein [Fusobacterium periodonticum]
MGISRWVHKLIFKPTLVFCGFVLLLLSGLFLFESSVGTDAIFLKEDYQIKEIVLQNLTDIENSGETISDELNEQVQHFNFLSSNLYIAYRNDNYSKLREFNNQRVESVDSLLNVLPETMRERIAALKAGVEKSAKITDYLIEHNINLKKYNKVAPFLEVAIKLLLISVLLMISVVLINREMEINDRKAKMYRVIPISSQKINQSRLWNYLSHLFLIPSVFYILLLELFSRVLLHESIFVIPITVFSKIQGNWNIIALKEIVVPMILYQSIVIVVIFYGLAKIKIVKKSLITNAIELGYFLSIINTSEWVNFLPTSWISFYHFLTFF